MACFDLRSSSLCSFAIVGLSLFDNYAGMPASRAIAHVPFDFHVGEMSFGAGPYVIEPSQIEGTCSLWPAEGDSPRVLVQAIRVPRQQNGLSKRLLFYHQGDCYFLAQVLAVADEPAILSPTPLL